MRLETTVVATTGIDRPAITLVISTEGGLVRGVVRRDDEGRPLEVLSAASPAAVVESALTFMRGQGYQDQATAIERHFRSLGGWTPS